MPKGGCALRIPEGGADFCKVRGESRLSSHAVAPMTHRNAVVASGVHRIVGAWCRDANPPDGFDENVIATPLIAVRQSRSSQRPER